MKYFIWGIAWVTILCALPVRANDGAYYSSGGIFYPMQEQRISIQKEVLSFTRQGDRVIVDVYFEFFNPDNTDRTLTVGFLAPRAVGDMSEDDRSINQIKYFRVAHEGQLLAHQLKVAACKDCPLKELSELKLEYDQFDAVFVYLFEVTFRPGINRINHSYVHRASTYIFIEERYLYTLTSGSKWAGGSIADFTMLVDMGPNSYFYVSDVFGRSAHWAVVGSGKPTGEVFAGYQDEFVPSRMVRVLSGRLQVQAKDLKPSHNIELGVVSNRSFTIDDLHRGQVKDEELLWAMKTMRLTGMDGKPLRLTPFALSVLKMLPYAHHGYVMKDPKLRAFFERFGWYMPDPNLTQRYIYLTHAEDQLLKKLAEMEK